MVRGCLITSTVENKMHSTDITKREAVRQPPECDQVSRSNYQYQYKKYRGQRSPSNDTKEMQSTKSIERKLHKIRNLVSSTSKLQEKENMGGDLQMKRY